MYSPLINVALFSHYEVISFQAVCSEAIACIEYVRAGGDDPLMIVLVLGLGGGAEMVTSIQETLVTVG